MTSNARLTNLELQVRRIQRELGTLGGGGTSDHGSLLGLLDDDHPHYLTAARGSALYSPLAHNHDAAYAALGHNHDAAYAGLVHTHVEADITDLGSYALATHNHDLDYSPLGHNHDASYSALGHNHDAAYAALGHNHDLTYAGLTHTHVEADITDLGSYALATHNHDLVYSPLGHNHDAAYAALTHNHDLDYAPLSHNHDLVYSALGHTHVEADITDLGSYALATHDHDLDYAALGHNHSGVYAPVSHTHVEADITDLQSYALASHNHTPVVHQRKDASSTSLSTTPVTVPFATAEIADSGFTFSSGVITAGSAVNGKRCVIDVAVHCINSDTNGRTLLTIYLYVGGSPVRIGQNYATRDANQNVGGAWINGYVTTLATGTTIEVRAAAAVDGGTAILATQKSYITVRTLD